MIFTCTKENLTHALQHVSGAAGKNIHLPILNNVLISTEDGVVSLTTTNLEMAIRTTVRAKVEVEGTFTVPARTLAEYIQLVSGEQVTIKVEDNELLVTAGKSKTKIKGAPSDEFPIVPQSEAVNRYSIGLKDLKLALARVLFACSRSEVRPELSGVFFQFNKVAGKLTMAATDSYRLAEVSAALAEGAPTDPLQSIIPYRTLFELARVLSSHTEAETVDVLFDESQVVFVLGDVTITTRKIEGTYPDYTQIIPKEFKTRATFLTDALTKEVKAASLFASQGINAVAIDCNSSESNIGISSTSTQLGEHASALTAEVSGEEGSTLLNYRYVLDGLGVLQADEGEIRLSGATAPVVFAPKDKEEFLYIVMPIRQ